VRVLAQRDHARVTDDGGQRLEVVERTGRVQAGERRGVRAQPGGERVDLGQ
jgi:hypothetical protein